MARPRADPWVIDVTDADFETQVIERSKQVPVVVDFWAPWCGPCRVLGPLLERLAEEHAGAFLLAEVNIDENPGLAERLSRAEHPDGDRRARRRARRPLRRGTAGERACASSSPSCCRARPIAWPTRARRCSPPARRPRPRRPSAARSSSIRAPIARCSGWRRFSSQRGEDAEALALLERVGPGPQRQEADRLAAAMRIRQSGAGDEAGLRARVAGQPDDLEARFALAQALAAGGRYDEALEHYLAIVKRTAAFRDDGARKAMLDIFDLLGPGNELADRYRSELAKVLFR